jgi:hypothetical protein
LARVTPRPRTFAEGRWVSSVDARTHGLHRLAPVARRLMNDVPLMVHSYGQAQNRTVTPIIDPTSKPSHV